ncbi:MAG: RNA pyrophosphohydrolase [Gammaproteobacteria bacterium]|nr:RNA pyrophosphohydrolase [Gammaproteobacteria bacterium]
MIDKYGFRSNVGIVLLNDRGQVFCGRRIGMSAWQFPQGGINRNESPETAMYRELKEEVGLEREHVELLGSTKGWLRYRLPKRYIRYNQQPLCIGQKQIWFLLKFCADEALLRLDSAEDPEFDAWRWVDYWDPLGFVVPFKRNVYERALHEFSDFVAGLAGFESGAATSDLPGSS